MRQPALVQAARKLDPATPRQGTQLLGANRRVSKQKLVEVSETVGWRGSHSLSAQVGGNKTGRMEDNAEQTE